MIDKTLVKKIGNLLSSLYEFVESDSIKPKFEHFVKKEVNESINSQEKMLELIQAFVFDYKIDGNQTLLDIYLKEHKNIEEDELAILQEWKNTIHSIFEILKVTKNSFECYNLVNEKTYSIRTTDNFLNYRNIVTGEYLFCRIAPLEDYHLLVGNLITFPKTSKKEMLEMAIMVQIENPTELFKDNPEKLVDIYENNAIKFQKFYDLFGSDEVFCSGQNLDYLLTAYTQYTEMGDISKSDIEDKIGKPSKYYFLAKNINDGMDASSPANFISEFANCHDAGLICDEKEGLSILPYYATFIEIFSNPDYKQIKGYKDCILYYLESEAISPSPFVKVITAYPKNAVKVFEDVLEQPTFSLETDFDYLMEEYKYEFLYNNRISTISVFDNSLAFKELMTIYEEWEEETFFDEDELALPNRNDPCPCGSGKKFKKCCINKIN